MTVEERINTMPKEDAELVKKAREVLKPVPEKVENEDNPLRPEKITLGKMLYYDTRLSRSNTISCNSCHNLARYGVDNNKTSMGHGWQLGPRNAPTVLNAAGQIAQFWDGRSPDVEDQATGPVANPIEMGGKSPETDHMIAVERIASIDEYQELFRDAFEKGDNDVTLKNIGRAIGAFERTLMTKAPVDKYLQGEEAALNEEQKEGLKTFMDVGCATCHNGTHIGGSMYRKFGQVQGPYWEFTGGNKDEGRYGVTGEESDKYVFKVPTLRNIEHTYPYFHDGSVWSLRKAIGIMGKVQLGVDLDEKQLDNLVAFMESLTGSVEKDTRTLPILPPSDADVPKPDYSVSNTAGH